jgi:hypothetical protein
MTCRCSWLRGCAAIEDKSRMGLGVLSLTLAGLLFPTLAAAQPTIAECMVERYNATKPANVAELNCTSNDVQLATYERVEGPTSCLEGETIEVTLKGQFVATSAERWDVGAFVSTDGGTPNALGGTCYQDYLHPVSADNTDLDLTGGSGPFYNGEITEDPGDACADIEQGQDAFFITQTIEIICQDKDNDNIADVDTCTVWANSRSDGGSKPSCIDESDVTAETSAKCTCGPVDIGGIDFEKQAHIEVIKDLVPAGSGSFNLQIDGENEATNVGDGGTTGSVLVSAGTQNFPGDTHTVGEAAYGETSLGSYTTSISCVDRGTTTFDGESPLTTEGPGPLVVPCDPDDDIVCTISNINACFGVDCTAYNTACGIASCNPAGEVGNCDIVTPVAAGSVVCRQGSGDVCDPDELCNGLNIYCPDDVVSPATTICNPGSGDICDPDESCTGVAGEACPADQIASSTTTCRTGSGDLCDPDESCTGVADAACPDDVVSPATTICNPGSGDICDPDESCTGTPGAACPADTIAPATTICRTGSGDEICDPDESCTGVADAACPADTFEPAGTECTDDDGNICTDGVCDSEGLCVSVYDPTNADICEGICLTAGFWGARAGGDVDKKDGSPVGFNYTQAVIDANEGCLNVCGQDTCGTYELLGNLGCAQEALCMRANNSGLLDQTYRQMTAAALNCVLSGASGPTSDQCGALLNTVLVGIDQTGTCVGGPFAGNPCDPQEEGACEAVVQENGDGGECVPNNRHWELCSSNCSDPNTADYAILSACEQQLDCWNNGLQVVDNGDGSWSCVEGTCSEATGPAPVYCGGDADSCALNECVLGECSESGAPCPSGWCEPNDCVQSNLCHQRSLCDSQLAEVFESEANGWFGCDPEQLGPASGQDACREAQRNDCLLSADYLCDDNPCDCSEDSQQ